MSGDCWHYYSVTQVLCMICRCVDWRYQRRSVITFSKLSRNAYSPSPSSVKRFWRVDKSCKGGLLQMHFVLGNNTECKIFPHRQLNCNSTTSSEMVQLGMRNITPRSQNNNNMGQPSRLSPEKANVSQQYSFNSKKTSNHMNNVGDNAQVTTPTSPESTVAWSRQWITKQIR